MEEVTTDEHVKFIFVVVFYTVVDYPHYQIRDHLEHGSLNACFHLCYYPSIANVLLPRLTLILMLPKILCLSPSLSLIVQNSHPVNPCHHLVNYLGPSTVGH